LAWFAGDVAALLLGEPYAEAEPIVRVLFIGAAFRSMIKLADALIRAVDALNVAILIKSIYLIGLGLSSWFVLSVGWGIEGVAWSVTIWTVVQFLFLSAWALRSAEWNLLDAIRSIVPGIKSLLIASALIGILSQALHYTMALYVPSASPLTIHLAHATLAIISTIIALFAAAVLHPEVVDGGDLELRKRWTAYLPLRLQNRIL
jgi:O-antigen/teichoic acid export membrane protein